MFNFGNIKICLFSLSSSLSCSLSLLLFDMFIFETPYGCVLVLYLAKLFKTLTKNSNSTITFLNSINVKYISVLTYLMASIRWKRPKLKNRKIYSKKKLKRFEANTCITSNNKTNTCAHVAYFVMKLFLAKKKE